MRAFTAKQNQSRQQSSPGATRPNAASPKESRKAQPCSDLADSSQAEAASFERPDAGSENKSTARFAHDFARIPVRAQAPIKLQPKLTVNLQGDAYEQEADQIAEQVMHMSEQKLQGACACGSKCPKCQTRQLGKHAERLQTKRVRSSDKDEADIPPIVHDVLASPGQPLDAATRAFMEPRFGHDFSHVRIHTDKRAAESTLAVNAMAYTVGSGIVFGAGQYSPRTLSGQQLLAHELVHTLQQSNGAASDIDRVSESHDPAEREADHTASNIMAGRQAQVSPAAGAQTLHRQPLPTAARQRRVPPRLLGREDLDSFALNSATLTRDQKSQLAIFAHTLKDLLQEYPGANVQITGHTDASGDESYNERLGQQRADAVADFLIKAGVPADAIATLSAGESELRVKTEKPEPRNRRAEVRFDPKPKSFHAPEPTQSTEPTKSTQTVPRPEQLCTDNPNLSVCQQGTGQDQQGGDAGQPDNTAKQPGGGPAGCAASAVGGYNKLPAALRKAIERKGIDPQVWFEDPALDRSALTSIYNRMCQYGLWDYVTEITEVTPGEPPVWDYFSAPGLTTEVHFAGRLDAMKKALGASQHFCQAVGTGNLIHKFPSWREISSSGSLHITVEPGEINAHIDFRSPTPEGTGSGFCPNAPTPTNLNHIIDELIPEILRKKTGLPGFQMTPQEEPPPAVPPGAASMEPFSGSTGFNLGGILKLLAKAFLSRSFVTLHPTGKRPRPRSSTPPLPADVEQMLDQQIPTQVARDALVPGEIKTALEKATRERDQAGPDEEQKLIAKLTAAQERFDAFGVDAHDFAKELARKMAQAAHTGGPGFSMDLGPLYAKLSPADTKVLLENVRDIARKARALLLKSNNVNVKAGGVYKIALFFGEEGYWDVTF